MNIRLGAVRTMSTACCAAAALVALLAGCAGHEPAGRSGSPTTVSAVPPAAVVSLTVRRTSFVGMPAQVQPGSLTVEFRNDTAATHMAAIGAVNGAHTARDLANYLHTPAGQRGLPSWLRMVGGIDDVDAGQWASWTGTLTPGRYLLLSLTPNRVGRSDALTGLVTPFKVTRGNHSTAPPVPAGATTITERSGGRLRVGAIAAGATALRVLNHDTTSRLVDITAIKPGKTFADVLHEARSTHGVPTSLTKLGGSSVPAGGAIVLGIEPAAAGTTYVVFDPAHLAQGAISHLTVH